MPDYVVLHDGNEFRRCNHEAIANGLADELRILTPGAEVWVEEQEPDNNENATNAGQSNLPVEQQPSVEIEEPEVTTVTIDQQIAREAAAEIEDLLETDRIAPLTNSARLREFCWQVREDISEIDYDNNPNQ